MDTSPMDTSLSEFSISKNVTLKKTDPGPSWSKESLVGQKIKNYESKLKKPVKRIVGARKSKDEPTIRELMNMFNERFDSLEDKIDSQATTVDSIENKINNMERSI